MKSSALTNKEQYCHAIKKNFKIFGVAIAVIVSALVAWFCGPEKWHESADPFGMVLEVIMLVVVFVGISLPQMKVQWVKDLDNYLNVVFEYDGKKTVVIELIPMASVAGAREQALALIGALNEHEKVYFNPFLKKFSHGKVVGMGDDYIELHTATIELTKPISEQGSKEKGLAKYGVDAHEYLYWDIKENKKIIRLQEDDSHLRDAIY